MTGVYLQVDPATSAPMIAWDTLGSKSHVCWHHVEILPTIDHGAIQFVETLPSMYECPVCNHFLNEPRVTSCGHHFCRSCIEKVIIQTQECPVCKKKNFNVYHDKATKEKMNSLEVHCVLKDQGCEWVGKLANLECHLDMERGDCSYIRVDCDFKSTGCTARPLRKDLPQHMEEDVHKHVIMMSNTCHKNPNSCENDRKHIEQQAELLQKQLQRKDEQIKQHIKELQAKLCEKDKQIAALEAAVHPCLPCEFVMSNFSKYVACGDEWLSPPFYSHPGGYQMHLSIRANENEVTHRYVSSILHGKFNHSLEFSSTATMYVQVLNHDKDLWEDRCSLTTSSEKLIDDSKLDTYVKNDSLHIKIST